MRRFPGVLYAMTSDSAETNIAPAQTKTTGTQCTGGDIRAGHQIPCNFYLILIYESVRNILSTAQEMAPELPAALSSDGP